MSEGAFKKRVIQLMRDTGSDTWRLVKSALDDLLGPTVKS